MEKIKGIAKHFLISEVITWLFIIVYLLFTQKIVLESNDTSNTTVNTFSGSDYMLFFIFIYLFIIIGLINLFYSILFYFINIQVPKIGSIILMLVILVVSILYYYTKTGPNLNVIYEHPVDTFNRETDKLINIFLMGLIIIHLLIKFISSIHVRGKK